MSNPLLIGFAIYGIISEFIGVVDLICIIRFCNIIFPNFTY